MGVFGLGGSEGIVMLDGSQMDRHGLEAERDWTSARMVRNLDLYR
jgi:hypothetical protein